MIYLVILYFIIIGYVKVYFGFFVTIINNILYVITTIYDITILSNII